MTLNTGPNKEEEKKDNPWDAAGLAIPGGLLLGMGVGFLIDELVAGLFIGLGSGFIVMALMMVVMRGMQRD